MGYNSINDLIEQEKLQKESNGDTNGVVEDFDFALASSRFPCIILGDSSVIELYDGVPHRQELLNPLLPGSYNNYLPYSVGGNWAEANGISEKLQFIGPPISDISSSSDDSRSYMLLYESRAESLDSATKSDTQIDSENSSTAGCFNSLDTSVSTEPILDKNIRCLPNATSRQCRQLEEGGFHTVRCYGCRFVIELYKVITIRSEEI